MSLDDSAEANLKGRVLADRYTVTGVLARGGMATTYLAGDKNTFGRQVVIKVPNRVWASDARARERFVREAKHLVDLDHPSIVTVLDVGTVTNEAYAQPFLVMKYMEGGDLRERVAAGGGAQSAREVANWLRRIAEALDFAHSRRVLHRDVKPANILFDRPDEAGQAFLADFGIARAIDGGSSAVPTSTDGSQFGSLPYLPPEAWIGEQGPPFDQYSLACTVYEVLSGELPHVADSGKKLEFQKQSRPARPLRDVAPQVPAACAAAVMRALETDQTRRFATCAQFAQAFAKGIDAAHKQEEIEETKDPQSPPRPPVPPENEKGLAPWRRSAWMGLAAVAVLVGAVVAYQALGPKDPDLTPEAQEASPSVLQVSGQSRDTAADQQPEGISASQPIKVTQSAPEPDLRGTLSISIGPQQSPRTVRGIIEDPQGARLGGVDVSIVDEISVRRPVLAASVTNDNGEFRITDLPKGTYTAQIRSAGFPPRDAFVDLQSGSTVDLGKLTLGEVGRRITDERGEFSVPGDPGRYIVRAELAGFTTVEQTGVEISRLRGAVLTFEVQVASDNSIVRTKARPSTGPAGTIQGVVRDSSGGLMPGVTIRVFEQR